MEPNLIQEKLHEAMEDARKKYQEAEDKYKELEGVFTEDWKEHNPNGSKAEMFRYLKKELKEYFAAVESSKEIYKQLVETYQKTMERMAVPTADQLLKVMTKIESDQTTLANHLILFIEELKLEQFALAASSERSNNQAVKLDCINYYNNTNLTSLPTTITCQFLGIDFPTNQVTCSHIFQRKWAQSRRIIGLQEINDLKNLLLLFKPIEILDPTIRNKTVLDLAQKQFPNFATTKVDPILNNTIAALEGTPLKTGQVMPYKRCLAFHASRARYEAIHIQKWIKAEDFIIPEDAWSPNILETPELKSKIELWLNQD